MGTAKKTAIMHTGAVPVVTVVMSRTSVADPVVTTARLGIIHADGCVHCPRAQGPFFLFSFFWLLSFFSGI